MVKVKRYSWLLAVLVLNHDIGCVLPRCENFVSAPEQTVYIPVNGETSLYCEHVNGFEGWYKAGTFIESMGTPVACDCVSTHELPGVRLTFSGFNADEDQPSDGEYACWANTVNGFERCNFEVVVAEPPMVGPSLVVAGNQLEATLTITPSIDVFGLPRADVTWLLNGQPVREAATVSNTTGALSVPDVVPEDRGLYTVTVNNSAGTFTRRENVTINFLVLDDPVFERAPAGGLLVTCRAIGFPPIVTVNLDPDSDFVSNPRETPVFESIVRNTYSFSECDPTTNYQCSAMTSSGQDSSTSGQPPEELCSTNLPGQPTNLRTTEVGETEVTLTWVAPAPTGGVTISGYRVMYRAESSSIPLTVDSTETTITITGLTTGVEYTVQVAALSENIELGVFSSAILVIPMNCLIDELTMGLSNVRVVLVNEDDRRTLALSWTASSEENVEFYSVEVMRAGPGTTDPSPVVLTEIPASRTTYILPAHLCDGSTYNFRVSPRDTCSRLGPMQSVRHDCSGNSLNELTVQVMSTEADALHLTVTLRDGMNRQVTFSASTIKPQGGYTTTSLFTAPYGNGSFCLGQLSPGTFYNICISTGNTDSGEEVCVQASTAAAEAVGGSVGPTAGCLSAANFITNTHRIPEMASDIVISGNEGPHQIGSSVNISCSSDLSVLTIRWLNDSDNGRELFSNSGQQQLLLPIERVTSSLANTMYTCEVQVMLATGRIEVFQQAIMIQVYTSLGTTRDQGLVVGMAVVIVMALLVIAVFVLVTVTLTVKLQRLKRSSHPAHVDTCTYDVVGGAYEVVKKSTAGGVSGEVKTAASKTGAEGGEEFSLSKCEAYGPVSSSRDTKGAEPNMEYEVIHSTSQV